MNGCPVKPGSAANQLKLAYQRDLRDADRIGRLVLMVSRWRDELDAAPDRLEHPDARWQPNELRETIDDTLLNLAGEADRVSKGPTVIAE